MTERRGAVSGVVACVLVHVLVFVGCGCSGGERSPEDVGAPGPSAARRWILGRQSSDGAFRSEHYAVLRGGRSTTAAVLRALARLGPPDDSRERHQRARAWEFLRGEAFDGAPVDYPSWTAALVLQAAAASGRLEQERDLIERAIAFLRGIQLVEANGWSADAPEHGGFGLGERRPVAPHGSELLSIATTAAVVEGLLGAGVPADDPAVTAALGFVRRCQDLCASDAADLGGFAFTPAPEHARSKAGMDPDGRPRPVGTSTADGIHALVVADRPADRVRIRSARRWLTECFTADRVPGFSAEQRHLEAALRVYWIEAASRVTAEEARRAELRRALAALQRSDGRVVGASSAMKEDDPLLATALALAAWARLAPH